LEHQLQQTTEENEMEGSPNYYRYRYLLGAMQQIELAQTVRLLCLPEEISRLDAITQAWRAASARMTMLARQEAGDPNRIGVTEPPASVHARLSEIANDPLFRATFSAVPPTFGVVEIDRLVAPQREVNLDYVEELRNRVPGNTIEELLEYCVGPHSAPPEWKVLQTAANQIVFTSKSLDLHFLMDFGKS
jgi:hypothetical protein